MPRFYSVGEKETVRAIKLNEDHDSIADLTSRFAASTSVVLNCGKAPGVTPSVTLNGGSA